jgi:hypothetical protein
MSILSVGTYTTEDITITLNKSLTITDTKTIINKLISDNKKKAKNTDKPKRPPTQYNIFMQSTLQTLKSELLQTKDTLTKQDNNDIFSQAAKMWHEHKATIQHDEPVIQDNETKEQKKENKKKEKEAKEQEKEAKKLEKEAKKQEKEAKKQEKEAKKLEKEAKKLEKEAKKLEKKEKEEENSDSEFENN